MLTVDLYFYITAKKKEKQELRSVKFDYMHKTITIMSCKKADS